ncbi:MAG: aldolase/citrate lyase family protein [Lachnospiraceae bacterium]|nr:aldolase/citrate lyase family protein [Lachnospiraceae bacterium]
MKNIFLEKTQKGEKTIGTFFEMGLGTVGEVVGFTDLDYVIVDSEHGPYGVESTMEILRGLDQLESVTPLVRVKDTNRNSILKMLDIGAKGLIIPQVKSLEEIKEIVRVGKYFPIGERGVAFGRCAGYGYADHAKGDLQDYFDTCNHNQLLIPQCETMGCLNEIEEIAATEGVDGIFVGPNDLSVAMGIPGQFDNPDFLKALERIIRAVRAAGKFTMIYCDSTKTAVKRLEAGFDSATINMDISFYVQALNQCVKDVKDNIFVKNTKK